jgi:biotin carboxylase
MHGSSGFVDCGQTLSRRLAIMFTSQVPILQLAELAADNRHLLWLVDRERVDVEAPLRVLNRLGTVVDITGLDADQAADSVARFSPDGIMAFADPYLMRASQIGIRLGLPVNSPDSVTKLTNKYAQRVALSAAGLPVPRFWPVSADLDAASRDELLFDISFPVIVKPQEGAGSQDVRAAADRRAMRSILDANARCGSPTNLIVEGLLADGWSRPEYPYADFISVESIMSWGRLSHLAVTGRSRLQEPFIETGNFIPTNLPDDVVDDVVQVAGRAIHALEATTGVFHTEIKITPNGPRIIEVNGRIGGSIPELLALATKQDVSLLDLACRVALGERLAVEGLLSCEQVGYSLRVPPPIDAVRLVQLDGVDAISHIPGVTAFEIMRGVGDPVDWRKGWDSCIYYALGAAGSHEDMWQAREQVMRTVKVGFDRR